MATPNFSALLPDVTQSELHDLTLALGINRTQVVIRAIHQLHQQETAMNKFHLSMWMTPQLIAAARRVLESHLDSFSLNERDGAREGLGCLKDAQPEYLMNLLPQDHPDRKEAFRILSEYTPFVDTPRKDI